MPEGFLRGCFIRRLEIQLKPGGRIPFIYPVGMKKKYSRATSGKGFSRAGFEERDRREFRERFRLREIERACERWLRARNFKSKA